MSDYKLFQAYVPERQNDYATYSQRGKRPFCNAFEGKKTNTIEIKSNLEFNIILYCTSKIRK